MLDLGRTLGDLDERFDAYAQAQQLIVDDAPQVFLYFQTQNVGMQNYIDGVRMHPAAHHRAYPTVFK